MISLPVHARLYKWTDAEGNTIYSQTPPPTETRAGHTELNERGLTLREVEAPLSEEEKVAREVEARKKAETAALLAWEEREDRMLLESFPSLHSAVDDLNGVDPTFHCLQRALHLRQHATGNSAVGNQVGHALATQTGQQVARLVEDAGCVGEQQQLVGAHDRGDPAGDEVSVDVVGVAVAVYSDRGDDGNALGLLQAAHQSPHLGR